MITRHKRQRQGAVRSRRAAAPLSSKIKTTGGTSSTSPTCAALFSLSIIIQPGGASRARRAKTPIRTGVTSPVYGNRKSSGVPFMQLLRVFSVFRGFPPTPSFVFPHVAMSLCRPRRSLFPVVPLRLPYSTIENRRLPNTRTHGKTHGGHTPDTRKKHTKHAVKSRKHTQTHVFFFLPLNLKPEPLPLFI